MFAGIEELTEEKVGGGTNARHLENPEPGDYWNEMMAPTLLVLSRRPDGLVTVITETVEKGNGWMWDFDKACAITIDQLRHETRYAYCYPRFHEKAVGWWKQHIGAA